MNRSDSISDSLKELIKKGRKRGYITVNELNDALPPEKNSSEWIEEVMTILSNTGINLIEDEFDDDDNVALF